MFNTYNTYAAFLPHLKKWASCCIGARESAKSKDSSNNGFELYDPITITSNSIEIHGVTSSIGGLIFYTDFYQKLEMNRKSAYTVLQRLKYEKHFVTISNEELQAKYPCVFKLQTHMKNASVFHLLTEEGFSRFVIEVELGKIRSPKVVQNLLQIRDEMAQVYTMYRKGELIKLESSSQRPALPPLSVTLKEELARADAMTIIGIDISVSASACIRRVEDLYDEDLSYLRLLVPRSSDEELPILSATMVGESLGLSAQSVNNLLEQFGFSYHTYRKKTNGKEIKTWNLTEKGAKYGEIFLERHGGKDVSFILWRRSIVEVLRKEIFPDGDQTTLTQAGA